MERTILSKDGAPRFFVEDRPLDDVDLADARVRSGPFTLPLALSRARLKQWQHVMLATPEVLVTLAVVDAAYLKVSWVQVVDRSTGERWEHRRERPFGDVAVARSLWDDRTWFRSGGYALELHSHLDAGRHQIDAHVEAKGDTPALAASLTCPHDPGSVRSTVVSLPVGRGRSVYSHKVVRPAHGQLSLGDRTWTFGDDGVAIFDVHKAHYPRHMFWRWSTAGGRLADGRLVGFNLTRNVVEDDVTYNENAIWIDGAVHRVGPAEFEYDSGDLEKPWAMRSACGGIEVEFEPMGGRGENTHIPGVAKSQFTQLYGDYAGVLRVGGEEIEIEGLAGLAEEHDAVW